MDVPCTEAPRSPVPAPDVRRPLSLNRAVAGCDDDGNLEQPTRLRFETGCLGVNHRETVGSDGVGKLEHGWTVSSGCRDGQRAARAFVKASLSK